MTAQELLDKIRNTVPEDSDGFKEILNLAIDNLLVDASEFSEISVGRATLRRWKFGQSRPVKAARRAVLSWLENKLQIHVEGQIRGPVFFSTNCEPGD